jgi:hypothetical protein
MEEYKLVETWLRRDPVRWLAGILGGLIAGAVAILVGMIFSNSAGLEAWFPVKLVGTIFLGPAATDAQSASGLTAGLILWEAICAFLGFVYAHFTGRTNSQLALMSMGLVWGIFTWIFIWNLFFPSFQDIFATRTPSGPALAVCLAFGVSLAIVGILDPILRGKRS